MRVLSSGDVELAVHDLGGDGPTLLISHATGFHGRCYEPIADALADRFHSIAFDYRGHGDAARPEGPVDWERYGDDAEAMAAALQPPLVAFGHSMGGACLLMAAHRNPQLFRALVVFEPIVFPPREQPAPGEGNMLAGGARRRRSSFASVEAAIANFAAKPPMAGFTPAALEAYVRHGFAAGNDGEVHLKCLPETEAATFEMGSAHRTWDALVDIETPVLVLSGRHGEMQPSQIAPLVADRLPNAMYRQLDELDHFGPMTQPGVVAELIASFLDDHSG